MVVKTTVKTQEPNQGLTIIKDAAWRALKRAVKRAVKRAGLSTVTSIFIMAKNKIHHLCLFKSLIDIFYNYLLSYSLLLLCPSWIELPTFQYIYGVDDISAAFVNIRHWTIAELSFCCSIHKCGQQLMYHILWIFLKGLSGCGRFYWV